jgi:zinc transport system permease protein
MPWPFEYSYMQLALVAGLVVGACAPLIGVFIVQKRMSLLGDGIGHLAFAGVAGGLFLGVWPIWSALAVAVGGAVTIERLRSRGTAQGDLALSLFFYGGIAAGVVLVGLAGSFDASIHTYLFGAILTARAEEVRVIAGLGVLIALTMALVARPLFAVAVDEEWARVAGLPVGLLNTVLSVLVAVTVVASMRVVGILLVAALMVLPVASAQLLARSQKGILAWSVVVGVVSVVLGLIAARVWGLAPGGTIVLVTIGLFAVVAGVSRASRAVGGRQARRASGTEPQVAAGGPDDLDPVLSDSQ